HDVRAARCAAAARARAPLHRARGRRHGTAGSRRLGSSRQVNAGIEEMSAASKKRAEREIEAADAAEVEPERVHLHMPVDIRSLSLVVLSVLACIFAL